MTLLESFIIKSFFEETLCPIELIVIYFWVVSDQLFIDIGSIRVILYHEVTIAKKRQCSTFWTELQFIVEILDGIHVLLFFDQ